MSSQQATYPSTQAMSTRRTKKGRDYTTNPLLFTDSSKDPEVYLRWETNMKQWLRSHNIPKEEKLSYALSMLDGEAYNWWLKEDAATYYTSKAVLDWGTLKSRMYREFTKKYQITTRSVKSTPNFQPSYEYKSTHCVQPKHKFIDTLTRRTKEEQSIQEEKIQQKLITTSLVEQQEPLKGKSCNSTNPLELMCYKCKQQGHIAKDCPTKKKTKADEFLLRTCQASPKHPNIETSMKDEVGKEVKSNPTVPTLGEDFLKQYEPKTMEAPQESSNLTPQVSVQTKAIEEVQCLSNSCEQNSVITHLSCQEILNFVSAKGDEDTNDSSQPKEKPPDEPTKMNKLDGSGQGNLEEHEKVSNKLVELELTLYRVYLKHLFLPKGCGKGIGIKEHMKDAGNDKESIKNDVLAFPLIKLQEEPPDSPLKLREVLSARGSDFEAKHYVSNTIRLYIFNHLVAGLNELINIKELEKISVIKLCLGSTFNKELSLEASDFYQRRLYILESIITHLFLAIEVECFADTKGKSEGNSYKLGDELHLKKRQEIVSARTSANLWNSLLKYDLNYSMAVIICLFLSLSVNRGIGQIKEHKEQEDVKEEPPEFCNQDQTPKSLKDVAKRDEEVNGSIQLKQKPPDCPTSVSFQGKVLNPYTLQWNNLTYLCVGEQVLRTKLFEEGGYDEAPGLIKTDNALAMEPFTHHGEEEGSESLGGDKNPTQTFSPSAIRIFRRTPKDFSAQKDLKVDFKNSSINWETFLAHLESHTKKNQPIISSHEGDMDFTSQVYSSLADLDLCAMFGVQRSNQEELSCKSTWYGILIHRRRFESWFHTKPRSYERDIHFSSQPDFNQAVLNLPALFGEPRLNQKDSSCKTNLFGILTHQGRFGTWNHINPNSYEKVMEFTRQGNLHLPYLEARNYGRFQERVLHQEELLHQQEDPKRVLKCIHDRWIRWVQPHSFPNQDLPYLNPRAFKPITLQRLLPNMIEDELKTFQVAKKVPKNLTYPAKPSRYKTNGYFLIWTILSSIPLQRLLVFNFRFFIPFFDFCRASI